MKILHRQIFYVIGLFIIVHIRITSITTDSPVICIQFRIIPLSPRFPAPDSVPTAEAVLDFVDVDGELVVEALPSDTIEGVTVICVT